MSVEIVVDLLINIILLVSLSVVYSIFETETNLGKIVKSLITGVLVSAIGIIIMYNHVKVNDGILFDGRSIVMLMSGMYFGTLPTIMGSLVLSLYRISLGGAGTIPGVLWVVLPGIIGLYWRNYRFNNRTSRISVGEQYIIFFATQVLMVVVLFLFPAKVSLESINAVAFPLVVFYPIGGLAVSMNILRNRNNHINNTKIKESEIMYNVLFHGASSYQIISDVETGQILKVNQMAVEKYGYTLDEFCQMTIYDLSPLSKKEVRNIIQTKNEKEIDFILVKHILKSGEIIDVEVRTSLIEINSKLVLFANVLDVTKRLEDERNFRDVNLRLEATLQSVTDGVIVTNEVGIIEIANDVARKYLSESNILAGEKITDVIRIYEEKQNIDFTVIYNFVINNNEPFSSKNPYILLSNDEDTTMYIEFSLSPIVYDERKTFGTILVFRDVTIDYEKTNRIQYISQHDFLTGLYNRYFIEEEMKRLDTHRQLPITLIIGDVNGLKLTNDSFGHIEGDNLLKEIGSILKKSCRSEDIIARWGGDEFLILLPKTSRKDAEKVVRRIHDLSSKSRFEYFTPSISLGVASKNENEINLSSVLLEAEQEMYNNKTQDGKILRKELLKNIENKLLHIHPELGLHSTNVAILCKTFGEYLSLPDEDISVLVNFATYHDIGWIAIDESILLKQDKLTDLELRKVKEHPEAGFRIMKSIPEHSNLAELIISHQEHFDGTGYPMNIKGQDIPFMSRILSICDAYDFMINTSIYKDQKTKVEALQEIKKCSGTQFDPELASKFITMMQQFKAD